MRLPGHGFANGKIRGNVVFSLTQFPQISKMGIRAAARPLPARAPGGLTSPEVVFILTVLLSAASQAHVCDKAEPSESEPTPPAGAVLRRPETAALMPFQGPCATQFLPSLLFPLPKRV